MKKYLLLPLILLVTACGGGDDNKELAALEKERDELQTKLTEVEEKISNITDSASTDEKLLPQVQTKAVKRQKFEHYIMVQGNVEAEKNVMLYAEAGGNIRKIHVAEGQQVKKGQTLVSFDADIVGRNISELKTRLELAEFAYERQKNLWEQGIGSEIQYQQAKNQKESLEASIATLRAQAGKSVISAPFSGFVDEIMPNEGEMVGPGMPVLRLLNLENVYVEADVSEAYLGTITDTTLVNIEFPAIMEGSPMRNLSGQRIDAVGKFINPANRTFKVRVNLPNDNKALVPNLLAYINIRDLMKDNVLVIPERFVRRNSDGTTYVFVLEEQDGQKVAVQKTVVINDNYSYKGAADKYLMTMVTSGLNEGEILITEGSSRIQNGQEVEVQTGTNN